MSINCLVLHGFRQNAERLKYQMRPLISKLKNINFVFIDAPFIHSDKPTEKEELGPYRQWWVTDRENLLTQKIYDTAEESVKHVEDIIKSTDILTSEVKKDVEKDLKEIKMIKFDYILAFSQGSSLLQLLPSSLIMKGLIIVGGIPVNEESKYKKYYDHPNTLHVIGINDPVVAPEASEKLASLYKSSKIFKHAGKHYVPTNRDAVDQFKSFFQ